MFAGSYDKWLSKWLYHFTFLPAINKSSCCSVSSPVFGIVGILDYCHCNKYVVVSHGCFNFHFLMTYDGYNHPFLCLFAICISSSMRCLFRPFDHFSLGYLFSYCWILGVLSIVGVSICQSKICYFGLRITFNQRQLRKGRHIERQDDS